MYTTNLRRIGNSTGTTFPKEMLKRYNLNEGDEVHIVETNEGLLITPYDPDFEDAMEAYRESAAKHRDALRELAKR